MSSETLAILIAVFSLSYVVRFIAAAAPRQLLLLSASYFLYAHWAGRRALIVLISSSLLNYFWGSVLRRRPTTLLLWVGIGFNVLLLGSFKYLLPLAEHWQSAAWETDVLQQIIIPVGISFWTFQGLSYLFDLYREEDVDPSLLEFCLYMAFWPTVLSGPVCRLPKMLPQFRRRPASSMRDDFSIGLIRIFQGLFMKLVFAQLLAAGLSRDGGVSAGFDAVSPARSGLDVWALAIGYGFELFFDFAGYSNIVIGAARLFGIRLHENFDRPYLALTPQIFWTRWHMSLSFWIRDYVFLPLATLRRNPLWPYAAIVISMVIFGFWHGAKFTYVAWGLYHGLLLLGHRAGQRLKARLAIKLPHPLGALLSWGATFSLVSLSYIFFRANDLKQALRLLPAVFMPRSYAFRYATLPHDYYLLLALMVGGYFIYAGMAELGTIWINSYRKRARERGSSLPDGITIRRNVFDVAVLWSEGVLMEKKWWCLTPMMLLLLTITTLSFFGQSSNIAPFIYTLF